LRWSLSQEQILRPRSGSTAIPYTMKWTRQDVFSISSLTHGTRKAEPGLQLGTRDQYLHRWAVEGKSVLPDSVRRIAGSIIQDDLPLHAIHRCASPIADDPNTYCLRHEGIHPLSQNRWYQPSVRECKRAILLLFAARTVHRQTRIDIGSNAIDSWGSVEALIMRGSS